MTEHKGEQCRLNVEFMEKFSGYDFSVIKEERIFLIGSISKAKEEFIKVESILQLKYSKLVSMCSIDGVLNKEKFSKKEWDDLQSTALRKLKSMDAVLCLDVGGYVGKETLEEINLSRDLEKPVYFLSKLLKKSE